MAGVLVSPWGLLKLFLQRSLRLRRVVHWSVRLESFGETRGMNPSYLPQERRVVLRRVLILLFYFYFVKAPFVLVCMLGVIWRGHRGMWEGSQSEVKRTEEFLVRWLFAEIRLYIAIGSWWQGFELVVVVLRLGLERWSDCWWVMAEGG